jgi:HlyD family secretion protein
MSGKRSSVGSKEDIEALLGVGRRSGWARLRSPRWLIALTVLLLGLGVVAFAVSRDGSGGGVRYRTDAVQRGDITVVVTATGTVEPTNKVQISSELSGIIRTVAVDFNSKVKKGQVLAELDTDLLRATVESARARVKAAEARVAEASATLAQTKQDLDRKKALAARKVASTQDLDTASAAYHRAEAGLASARADVEAAEADLKLNETNLEKACICAPVDGVVLSRNVEPGQVVAASLQAPELFTIAEDLTKMEVQVDVDEADVGKVREGQTATFSVDAYPDRRFDATIKQLRFGSEIVQGVVTYKAVLVTDNPDLLLRPGMTATAEIVVQQEKDVLTVSNEALRFTPPISEAQDDGSFLQKLLPGRPRFRSSSPREATGPERQVRVLQDGEATPVAVRVGASDGQRTVIADGPLKAGDKVIVDAVTPSQ